MTPNSCDHQVHLDLPCPQRVVQLPDIGWTQYTSGLGDFERELCDKKRKTRRLKLIFDQGTYIFVLVLVVYIVLNQNNHRRDSSAILIDSVLPSGLPARPKSPVELKKEGESSTMYSSLPTSDALENSRHMQVWLCLLRKITCTTPHALYCEYLQVYH